MSQKAARRIDGETKLMGILGHGIRHTLSPLIHNFAANQLGKNVVYVPFDVAPGRLKDTLSLLWDMGCEGLNVTTPHKSAVAELYPESGLTSVNTLKRGPDSFVATSTDGAGFALGLKRLGRTLDSFERLVILGSGGASLAICNYLRSQALTPEVLIRRRDPKHDGSFGALGQISFGSCDIETLTNDLDGRGSETLLIQATSAPLRGDDLSWAKPALANFKGVVSDLIYGQPSRMYFDALSLDLTAQDGEAMLIEQARLAQKFWWESAVSYDQIALAIRGK